MEKDTGTTSLTPVGVFMGCSYTDPNTNQKTFPVKEPLALRVPTGSAPVGAAEVAIVIS